MKKYVVTRKEICAGKLMGICDVSMTVLNQDNNELTGDDLVKHSIPELSVSVGIIYRSMLFRVNENHLATDLIYTTPTKYTIKGLTPDLTDQKSHFIIDNYVELDELLKYLNYGDELTQRDLYKIYRKLIVSNKWLNHNMELFGWKKCGNGFYVGGEKEIISKRIYDCLSSISCYKNGCPHPAEPGYELIKKRQ